MVEVLVGLLILSLIGIGAWSAVSVSLRNAARFRDKIVLSTQLLQMDNRVRALSGRIHVPYWAADYIVEQGDGELRVAYLDGDPGKAISLVFAQGILSIDDGENAVRYTSFQLARLATARDAQNHVYGLNLELETKDGRKLVITTRFGGTPMRGQAGT